VLYVLASKEAINVGERQWKETMPDVLDWGIKVVLRWQPLF